MENGETQGYFAYVIRFKYKTRGLEPERGILNVEIGMRRFLQRPIQNIWKIDSRYAGSILFGLKNQFYVDETIRSMVQLKFKRMGNVIRWKKGFGSLFADVIFNNKKYSPMSMIQNPMKYLKKSDMVSLVVYSNQVYKGGNQSRVQLGVGLPEKWVLFNLVRDTFPSLQS
ncbi:MAG TPA: DUF3962 domain-containing protein [Candidatus Avamphibacillus sp.]|nr:DUF3962 domain-containing protein [Candidatus Avamphibacillus sp.]